MPLNPPNPLPTHAKGALLFPRATAAPTSTLLTVGHALLPHMNAQRALQQSAAASAEVLWPLTALSSATQSIARSLLPFTALPTGKVRRTNCNSKEHSALARSCMRVSEGPIIGSEQTEQNGYAFLECILHDYKEKHPISTRFCLIFSVATQIKLVFKECVRLAGCFGSVH